MKHIADSPFGPVLQSSTGEYLVSSDNPRDPYMVVEPCAKCGTFNPKANPPRCVTCRTEVLSRL